MMGVYQKIGIVRTLSFLLLVFAFCRATGQEATLNVRGTVRSDSVLLPNVTVFLKENPKISTQTGEDGSYHLRGIPTKGVLVFTCLGFIEQQIPVENNNLINVKLAPLYNTLENVIVVGFGTQKKINLTGAVGVVDSRAIENKPVQNAVQALQGVMPGLNIAQSNGSLESTPSINIRGTGSISSSSSASPLILIDGMEGDINSINPQDIDNISILKDASSSSIYGSRAAFGVILVTTKKGKAGRTRINYNNNLRSSSPINLPREMDSYTFALYFNDGAINAGNAAIFDADKLSYIKDYQEGKISTTVRPSSNNPQYWDGYTWGNDNIDWYRAIYRTHTGQQEHNISVTGGNDRVKYYISGNYMNQQGSMVFNQDYYNRYTFTAKIDAKLSDIISLNYSSRFLRTEYQRPSSLTGGLYNDLARQGWPILPLYDNNGYLYSSPSPALNLRDGGKDRSTNDWLYQQLQFVFEPIKGWKTYAELNYRTNYDFRHWDQLQTFNHDVNGNPYISQSSSNVYEYGYQSNYFNTNIYSEYSKTVAQKHNFKIMGGFQTELNKYHDLSVQRVGVIVPELPTINTTSGISYDGKVIAPSISGQYQNWATAGFFGRLNYDFDGRYLFEGNLRYDGSSRFRSNNRWSWFPSVSIGWNIAREKFWIDNEHLSFVNLLKLRASYGQLGNQNTNSWYPTYQTMPVTTAGGYWLVNGQQPNVASAPGLISSTLTWETVKSYDLALDWGLFNNRLTGSFDLYERKTLNMVGPAVELPVTLGTSVPPTNNMDLKTRGWELQIGYKDHTQNGFGYSINLSMSDYLTFVTRYPNPTGRLDQYRADDKNPINQIWGYTTVGIAKTQEEMDAHLATLTDGQNIFGSKWAAGDIMYADYNKDGKLDYGSNTFTDHGDLHIIGNSSPRYNFGLDINLDYKGFDFRSFFQGIIKRDYFQQSYVFWGVTQDQWWSAGLVQHKDYFRDDPNSPLGLNLNSYYARPVMGSNKNQQTQTRYLLNAAYIRLKTLQVGYTLPSSWTQKFRCNKLRIYFSGENLWTGTKMSKIFDPETVDGNSGFYSGPVYPLSKVISGGLSITF